ncbi:hypothetical protein QA612_22160 [Evansella sp. AB-P1]|uniref:hypothetical protein n=1 Tax=Evansella sp. AB-P1 TaxID=3037653 RepID=UPI00241BE7B7|nr:hypothetical protein [Evansella sp. AB-P1]MDG5790147.1 hypothetical protein [Evansella sp. AB-P1]
MDKVVDVFTKTRKGYNIKKVRDGVMRKNQQFDDAFPNGVFAVPKSPDTPKVKVRALYNYCQEKGVEPKDLTTKEMEMFLE